jgi:hypothetical protein
MKTRNLIAAILLSLLLMAPPVIAQEATQAADATPTMEAAATETPLPVAEPATDIQFTVAALIEFFTNNLPIIFMGIALVMSIKQVGKPQTQAEYDAEQKAIVLAREEVKKTKSLLDDLLVEGRYIVNEMRGIAQTPPTLPAPQPPVIDISHPPVGNTGTSTMDMSTPSYNPTIPIKENKYLAPYETRLDFPQGRQVHVPVNMGYVYELKNLAKDTEYPHPNVNVNQAYGARFDVAFIAGSWGFSYLSTLVKGVEYKVSVDYSAEITGKEISHLSDWLWWELDLDNKPSGLPNVGISNGARHLAEWTITGTGLPVVVTPRIRAAWASSGSNSAIVWHNLTITPVETLAG